MVNSDNSISFYFFDLDDNTFFLETPVFVRNKKTREIKSTSTHEFAQIRGMLGAIEPWKDYELFDNSYRNFRDRDERGKPEYLVEDIRKALKTPPDQWQGPAFDMFNYACDRQRPLAIVTARGHSRETIKSGISVMVEKNHLSKEPNYLGVYAVSNEEMRKELLETVTNSEERKTITDSHDPTSPLKRVAIRNLVEKALEEYGSEPEHRFGMSDDDPKNCLLYTSPSPRDLSTSRMPSSA